MNGIYYKGDIKDTYIAHILKEIYIDKVFDTYFLGKENLTVVDVGANIGLTTQYFSKYANKVVSVEPTKDHFECLTTLIKENSLDNVQGVNKAVGVKNGKQHLYHSKNVTMNSLSPLTDDTGEKEDVEVITMDKLFEEQKLETVDFMKVDIEGAEVDVISGENFAMVAERIKNLTVEYHTWSNRNPGQLVQALESYGFKVGNLKTDASLYFATRV